MQTIQSIEGIHLERLLDIPCRFVITNFPPEPWLWNDRLLPQTDQPVKLIPFLKLLERNQQDTTDYVLSMYLSTKNAKNIASTECYAIFLH